MINVISGPLNTATYYMNYTIFDLFTLDASTECIINMIFGQASEISFTLDAKIEYVINEK